MAESKSQVLTVKGEEIFSGNEIERFGEEIHDHRRAIEDLRPPYAISMNWASRRELLRELVFQAARPAKAAIG